MASYRYECETLKRKVEGLKSERAKAYELVSNFREYLDERKLFTDFADWLLRKNGHWKIADEIKLDQGKIQR